MTKDTGQTWEKARQNLLTMLKEHPGSAIDVIDSAYLAGLEDRPVVRENRTTETFKWDNIVQKTAYEYLRTDLKIPENQALLISAKLGTCASNFLAQERKRILKVAMEYKCGKHVKLINHLT